MNQQTRTERVAVVCGPGEDRRKAMQGRMAQQDIDQIKWFAPGRLHDLDRAVLNGQVRHIVFGSISDLLQAIWDEEIAFQDWPATDLRIDFLDSPEEQTNLRLIAQTWQTWRRAHRRRQAIAGAVVSAVVLGLSFLLCVVSKRL
jgi:hypothetical protein